MMKVMEFAERVVKFPRKPWSQKVSSFLARWNHLFPGFPPPIRLPSGIWWLFDMNFIGNSVLEGGYENTECRFERCLLKPGMTVLDIGAHCGFHTLLLSKSVGPRGRVLAFEPSPWDRKRLRLHVAMNFCWNVRVLPWALGEQHGSATLYVVRENTVLNSLRPQPSVSPGTPMEVTVRRLDSVLSQLGIMKVDFVKLDVEGAELAVLKGAERLLCTIPRPVVLCEVLEETARAWGYSSRQIIEHLFARRFVWFELNDGGQLTPVDIEGSELHGNLVAVPTESLQAVAHLYARESSGGASGAASKEGTFGEVQ